MNTSQRIPFARFNAIRKFFTMPSVLVGISIVLVISLLAIFGPMISGYSYFDTDLINKNTPPNLKHWFGTDDLGRDLFTRVWFGARVSLSIGIAAALIDVFIGIFWGATAAYFGGKIEEIMMRFADVLYSLPYLMLVIIFSLSFGSGFFSILASITVLGWISMARIVRGHVKELKKREFVLAAIALGASYKRLLFKYFIPNCMGPIIVTLTTTIPSAIFIEAFLSFLGLGIQAPIASWGSMSYDGVSALTFYPWRLLFPAFAISLTMLGFNLIGDGLATAFEHKENQL